MVKQLMLSVTREERPLKETVDRMDDEEVKQKVLSIIDMYDTITRYKEPF